MKTIANTLSFIASLLLFSSASYASGAFFCVDGKFVNNKGEILAEFDFQSSCNAALETSRGGLWCKDGKLSNETGQVLVNFNLRSACLDALEKVAVF